MLLIHSFTDFSLVSVLFLVCMMKNGAFIFGFAIIIIISSVCYLISCGIVRRCFVIVTIFFSLIGDQQQRLGRKSLIGTSTR